MPTAEETAPSTALGPRAAVAFLTARPRALVCLLFILWMLPGLVGRDPWKPDEAYSFGLVYHVLHSGDWVVPTLADEPFMEKPPLFYLTAALLTRTFGRILPLHDAARLACALYMGLAFAFLGLAAKELYGRGRGWLGALALMGCIGLIDRAHYLITDLSLLAGFVVALYGLALAPRRWILGGFWLGVGTGIGFMSKGLLAPGMLGLTCLVLPAAFPQWRTKRYLATLGVAVLAALPWLTIWPVALYLRSHDLFYDWLWVNNFGRFLGLNSLGPKAKLGYYLGVLPWFAWPVWPLAFWALWVQRRDIRSNAGLHLPLTAFLVGFIVLSVSRDARELYALPLLPPLSLLAIVGLPLLRRGAANALWWFSLMVFCFFALVGWYYWVALDLSIPARLHAHLLRLRPAYIPNGQMLKFVLAGAFTAAWIWIIPRLPRNAERPLLAWTATITLLWAIAAVLFIPWVDSANSYRSMVVAIRDAVPAHSRCVSSFNLGEPQRAMLEYFGHIVTYRETEPARKRDCDLLLVQGRRDEMHIPDESWRLVWEGARPGDNRELYRLYQKKPRGKG
ncbi:MAG TPA: hypothetical protein VMH32_01195 [Burkholderiales bacterium]|nr:hypothetical protein [Burkholderiales bacterium]